jgi:CHAD domain-containing protein
MGKTDTSTGEISVPVSFGEVLDKITILEIKSDRLGDEAKLHNVREELRRLRATFGEQFPELADDVRGLVRQLKQVNEALWEIEDDIRECERRKSFEERFVELARAVYTTNDVRAALKRELNLRLGSQLIEEKSYTSYA